MCWHFPSGTTMAECSMSWSSLMIGYVAREGTPEAQRDEWPPESVILEAYKAELSLPKGPGGGTAYDRDGNVWVPAVKPTPAPTTTTTAAPTTTKYVASNSTPTAPPNGTKTTPNSGATAAPTNAGPTTTTTTKVVTNNNNDSRSSSSRNPSRELANRRSCREAIGHRARTLRGQHRVSRVHRPHMPHPLHRFHPRRCC